METQSVLWKQFVQDWAEGGRVGKNIKPSGSFHCGELNDAYLFISKSKIQTWLVKLNTRNTKNCLGVN